MEWGSRQWSFSQMCPASSIEAKEEVLHTDAKGKQTRIGVGGAYGRHLFIHCSNIASQPQMERTQGPQFRGYSEGDAS